MDVNTKKMYNNLMQDPGQFLTQINFLLDPDQMIPVKEWVNLLHKKGGNMNDNKIMEMYGRRFTPLAGVLTILIVVLFALFLMFAEGRGSRSSNDRLEGQQPVSEWVLPHALKPIDATQLT